MQPVVVETSFLARDADRDARARLGHTYSDGAADILSAIAVHFDQTWRLLPGAREVTERLLNGGLISYALHQQIESEEGILYRRWPSAGLCRGSVVDLAQLITSEAIPKEVIADVAHRVAFKVRQAAKCIQKRLHPELLSALTSIVHQRSHLSGLNTTMVLWLNAIVVHFELIRLKHPKTGQLQVFGGTVPRPDLIYDAWHDLLQQNWYFVFQPAVKVLGEFLGSDSRGTSDALRLLTEAARDIETSRVGAHLNVGAELFPRLADDRKESAAFYTQPATAELLANLTIRFEDKSKETWQSPDFFRKHSIADLACGTGTLLRAGYRAISFLREPMNSSADRSLESFHSDAMESGMIGTDISPIAAHLTTSSLAMMNLKSKYFNTRVGWLEIGGSTGTTGALEYLRTNQATDLFDQIGGRTQQLHEEPHSTTIEVVDQSVDWILMNPPYSRTRGGQSSFDVSGLSEAMRNKCQARWGLLTKQEPTDNRAGMAASFLVIAKKKIKPLGRIGFVLPLTAAFATTWRPTREMVLREFHDIVALAIASGKAIGTDALSADTGMEEMLLIATRNAAGQHSKNSSKITFVMLKDSLTNLGNAGEIAKAILTTKSTLQRDSGCWCPILVGNDEIGHLFVEEIAETQQPWTRLAIKDPNFGSVAINLIHGELTWKEFSVPFGVPMTTLAEMVHVGPTHHSIGHLVGNDPIGAFELHEMQPDDSKYFPDLSIWKADAATQKQLLVNPTHKAISVPTGARPTEEQKMRQFKGTLMYSRNMSWTSQSLVAATTTESILGGRSWVVLQHEQKLIEYTIALWANSTLGMIVHWTQGQRTHPGRSTTQIEAVKSIPCPNFEELSRQALEEVHSKYESLKLKTLLPACQAHCDPVRHEFDKAIVQILGLPTEAIKVIEKLRYMWCREPSVHGNNKAAIALLNRTDKDV